MPRPYCPLAQLVEQNAVNVWVVCSNQTGAAICGAVVKLVITLACHARGREFESRRLRHLVY